MINLKTVKGDPQYKGNWCGSGEDFGYILETSESDDSCTAADCWNQLAGKNGVEKVNWDGKTCLAYGACKSNVPSGFDNSSSCSNKPSVCSNDKNIECNSNGDVTDTPKTKGWDTNGQQGAEFDCIEVSGGKYNTKLDCINKYCTDGSQKCCADGWTYNSEYGKCLQDKWDPNTEHACGPSWIDSYGSQCSPYPKVQLQISL